ncbi:endo alpha-1,4 polygalactosaminidase [Bhargavaea ullalensis]|uniref:Endo-alpha-1,4-polygalactosaminidase (GH114 family) n=1 Tax=Bhargavaea ullalensis TaxID=1265685 RepID=A0ABV2GE96_9BACL
MHCTGIPGLLALFSSLWLYGSGAGEVQLNGMMDGAPSYKIYYGEADPHAIDVLSHYGLAIIEPDAFTEEQVHELQRRGTRVLGYVSVMELEEPLAGQVNETDFLLDKGKRWYIKKWDTYMMDIREAHYRDVVMGKVRKQVAGKGMDGVFFDTAGNIDDYFMKKKALQSELREGYMELLRQVGGEFPDLYIMQNWGFGTVKAGSLEYIDGVMWEDFGKWDIMCDEWSREWIAYFRSKQDRLDLLTVTKDRASYEYSRSLGFLPTFNQNDIYDDL